MSAATAYPYSVAPPRGPTSGVYKIQVCASCGTPVRGVHEPKFARKHLVVECPNPDCENRGFLPYVYGTKMVMARIGYIA
jgi:hypothetical protein